MARCGGMDAAVRPRDPGSGPAQELHRSSLTPRWDCPVRSSDPRGSGLPGADLARGHVHRASQRRRCWHPEPAGLRSRPGGGHSRTPPCSVNTMCLPCFIPVDLGCQGVWSLITALRREQLMHGGDQDDLLGFAPGDQTRVEGPDHRMSPDGGERSPIQDPMHRGLAAPDRAVPLELAARG